jgi:periplasmic divalent cation tolerance protein
MENIRVVFISVPQDEAKKFGREIVERRLAACVNIIPKINSIFWWEDEIQTDEEALLILKTTQLKIDPLIRFIKEEHPYDVPEIIFLPVAEGLPDYINWVMREVGKEPTADK